MWVWAFIPVMCCVIFVDLHMLNNPCTSGMKPTYLWCMTCLMCSFSFLAALGFELRASLLLSRHSTTWATSPTL
jgi:hypothetical protein